jgi:hypothetical protein
MSSRLALCYTLRNINFKIPLVSPFYERGTNTLVENDDFVSLYQGRRRGILIRGLKIARTG